MSGAAARTALVVFLFGLPAAPLHAATLHGRVVGVADGDTLTLADGRQRRIKVRLSGIDAPEKNQVYGRQSAAHLASLVLGKAVEVEWDRRDAYGRVIGRVLVAPNACPACAKLRDAGLAQIAAGYAWWYRSESRELAHADKFRYAFAENTARARHGGLWAAPNAVPPWQWRHSQAASSSSLLAKTSVRIRKTWRVVRHPLRSMRHALKS